MVIVPLAAALNLWIYDVGFFGINLQKTQVFLLVLMPLLLAGYIKIAFHRKYYRFFPKPLIYLLLLMGVLVSISSYFNPDHAGGVFQYSSLVLYTLAGIPLTAHFLFHNRANRGKAPRTLETIINSVIAYILFITGCLMLTLLGVFLFVLIPGHRNGKKRRLLYHHIIRNFCRFLIFATVRKHKTINLTNNTFTRPSIVIANHQSFIDLIVILSLNPNLVLLTNDWVWNSPLFGRIVRWADYYPVSSGIENSLVRLKNKVDQGFSIVVFPEGTRSENGKIKRFKKGAFYLAEKLGLDILPVFLHGTGIGITKGEFLLKKTFLTTMVSDGITQEDRRFSNSYSQRTKEVTTWFRKEYTKFQKRCMTPSLMEGQMKHAFAFRGRLLNRKLKSLFVRENYLLKLALELEQAEQILHLGCGAGEIGRLLNMQLTNFQFIGLDSRKTSIEIAADMAAHDEHMTFMKPSDFNPDRVEFDACLVDVGRIRNDNEITHEFLQNLLERLKKPGKLILYNFDRDDRQEMSYLFSLNDFDNRGWQRKSANSERNPILIFRKLHA